MYKIDLSAYKIPVERWEKNEQGERVLVTTDEDFPIGEELYDMLRLPGLFQNLAQAAESIIIGRSIRDCKEDFIELDDKDYQLVVTAMNKLVARPHNPAAGTVALGGPRYEEFILRIHGANKS